MAFGTYTTSSTASAVWPSLDPEYGGDVLLDLTEGTVTVDNDGQKTVLPVSAMKALMLSRLRKVFASPYLTNVRYGYAHTTPAYTWDTVTTAMPMSISSGTSTASIPLTDAVTVVKKA